MRWSAQDKALTQATIKRLWFTAPAEVAEVRRALSKSRNSQKIRYNYIGPYMTLDEPWSIRSGLYDLPGGPARSDSNGSSL